MIRLALRFDLRVPPFAATSFAVQHGAMLEMATWGDRLGFDTLGLSEHHGDPAGFTSAPIPLNAGALPGGDCLRQRSRSSTRVSQRVSARRNTMYGQRPSELS